MARSSRRVSRVLKVRYRARPAVHPTEEKPDILAVGNAEFIKVRRGIQPAESIRIKGAVDAPVWIRDLKTGVVHRAEKMQRVQKLVKNDPKTSKPFKTSKQPPSTVTDTEHYYALPPGFESVTARGHDDENPSEYSAQHASAAARIRMLADQKAGKQTADWIVKLAGH